MRSRYANESSASLLSEGNSGFNPYPSTSRCNGEHSVSDKYSLDPDPETWGSHLYLNIAEPDDELHNPSARKGKWDEHGPFRLSSRAIANLGCLAILLIVLLTLFVGYPVATFVQRGGLGPGNALNAKVNGTGQVPSMTFGLIDRDTPSDAYTRTSLKDGSEWKLVFSDEFNTDGRSFYPGDDPYWEAVNLNYWETNNLEWYDPAAITTANGSLVITYEQKQTHNLNYQGGMMSTWNKFCFTGGYFEASVMLPGINNVAGMWPALWTLGNLGRAGYGATLDGMWPYTYDSCDVGTAPNQTHNGLPKAALQDGDASSNFALSYLPGQRLSKCTCSGESHPGPVHSDGTYVGRSAPEIDMLEAQITGEPLTGQVSQSAQWAPFNDKYIWLNTSANLIIPNTSISALNSYIGGNTQQATSVVTETNQDCYELSDNPCYATYGFEYAPGKNALL
jgi:beta-glucan synthesis-associated protein KRE6